MSALIFSKFLQFSRSFFCFLEQFWFSRSGLGFLEVLSVLWKRFGFSGRAVCFLEVFSVFWMCVGFLEVLLVLWKSFHILKVCWVFW